MKRFAAALVSGLCAVVLLGPASQAAERAASGSSGHAPPVIPKPPCAGGPSPQQGPAPVAGSAKPTPTTELNRHLATADARKLLADVKLPRGASLRAGGLALRPRGGHYYAVELDSARDWQRWVVPGRLCAVFADVIHRLPHGLTVSTTGWGGPTASEDVAYERPSINGRLGIRLLLIDASRRSANSTLLYVLGQSQWLVTRSPKERVPASAKIVDVRSTNETGKTIVLRVVTKPSKVRALIRLVNSLGVGQPGTINCPDETATPPTVMVTFRHASGGASLASTRAQANADFNWPDDTPGWACLPTTFTLDGKTQPELWGNLDGPLERILHVRLTGSK